MRLLPLLMVFAMIVCGAPVTRALAADWRQFSRAVFESAFAAGYHSGHLAEDAHAATQEMMPVQIINLNDLKAAEISAPSNTGSRSRQLAGADGMTAGERVGLWAPNSREWVAAAVGEHLDEFTAEDEEPIELD